MTCSPATSSTSKSRRRAGTDAATRSISRGFVRPIRRWSRPKLGRPASSSATISPSTRASSSSTSGSAANSGYRAVMSMPFRLSSRMPRPSTRASTRMPSHFHSSAHSSPVSRPSVPAVASIGRSVIGSTSSFGLCRALRAAAPVPRPLVLHAVQQPVALLPRALGADQREAHLAERPARASGEREDDLVVAPLLESRTCPCPRSSSLPAPYSPFGIVPSNTSVLHRVVLGLHGEVVPARGRRARPSAPPSSSARRRAPGGSRSAGAVA